MAGVIGTPDVVAVRISEHLQAGADHVLLSPYGDLRSVVDQLEKLIPTLRQVL